MKSQRWIIYVVPGIILMLGSSGFSAPTPSPAAVNSKQIVSVRARPDAFEFGKMTEVQFTAEISHSPSRSPEKVLLIEMHQDGKTIRNRIPMTAAAPPTEEKPEVAVFRLKKDLLVKKPEKKTERTISLFYQIEVIIQGDSKSSFSDLFTVTAYTPTTPEEVAFLQKLQDACMDELARQKEKMSRDEAIKRTVIFTRALPGVESATQSSEGMIEVKLKNGLHFGVLDEDE